MTKGKESKDAQSPSNNKQRHETHYGKLQRSEIFVLVRTTMIQTTIFTFLETQRPIDDEPLNQYVFLATVFALGLIYSDLSKVLYVHIQIPHKTRLSFS